MSYLVAKSLHLIFMVTWFAGLFYIVRLFIYSTEANQKDEGQEVLLAQFEVMQKRLWYGITWPSAVLTAIFGSSLLGPYLPLSQHPWLMLKLGFLLGLYAYHFYCQHLFKQIQKRNFSWSSQKLRLFNEVPTLFLFTIVFLAVFKDLKALTWGLLILPLLSLLLFLAIKIYRRLRQRSQ